MKVRALGADLPSAPFDMGLAAERVRSEVEALMGRVNMSAMRGDESGRCDVDDLIHFIRDMSAKGESLVEPSAWLSKRAYGTRDSSAGILYCRSIVALVASR